MTVIGRRTTQPYHSHICNRKGGRALLKSYSHDSQTITEILFNECNFNLCRVLNHRAVHITCEESFNGKLSRIRTRDLDSVNDSNRPHVSGSSGQPEWRIRAGIRVNYIWWNNHLFSSCYSADLNTSKVEASVATFL